MTHMRSKLSLGLLLTFVIGLLFFGTSHAQTSCANPPDGPVSSNVDVVKGTNDTLTVSWVNATQVADVACTPLSSDPALALTGSEVFFSMDDPVTGVDTPIGTVGGTVTSYNINLSLLAELYPGADVFVAVRNCNQFGCSALSGQPRVKIGGPPGKPENETVQ